MSDRLKVQLPRWKDGTGGNPKAWGFALKNEVAVALMRSPALTFDAKVLVAILLSAIQDGRREGPPNAVYRGEEQKARGQKRPVFLVQVPMEELMAGLGSDDERRIRRTIDRLAEAELIYREKGGPRHPAHYAVNLDPPPDARERLRRRAGLDIPALLSGHTGARSESGHTGARSDDDESRVRTHGDPSIRTHGDPSNRVQLEFETESYSAGDRREQPSKKKPRRSNVGDPQEVAGAEATLEEDDDQRRSAERGHGEKTLDGGDRAVQGRDERAAPALDSPDGEGFEGHTDPSAAVVRLSVACPNCEGNDWIMRGTGSARYPLVECQRCHYEAIADLMFEAAVR